MRKIILSAALTAAFSSAFAQTVAQCVLRPEAVLIEALAGNFRHSPGKQMGVREADIGAGLRHRCAEADSGRLAEALPA